MPTNKPLFVRGLAQSDPVLSSASRSSRKSDANFAAMLEKRETMTPAGQASVLPERAVAAQTGRSQDFPDQTKKQALDALTKLIDSDPSNGGVYKPQGISAMRTLLSSTLTLPDASPNGQNGALASASQVTAPAQADQKQAVPSAAALPGQVPQVPQAPQAPRVTNLEQTLRRNASPIQGMVLQDRSRGIPIDVRQQRGEAIHNVALNRNRPRKSETVVPTPRGERFAKRNAEAEGLGSLAARYESGSEGIAAIGYDRTGGTSYGKYQIASRPGSMAGFLSFLEGEAPDIAERLTAAGPANTGSRKGEMPEVWRAIASEEPDRFEDLQERFIHQSHYEPALNAVQRIGYDTRLFSPAMKEVLWSTAVQHGPSGAASIFAQAAEGVGLGTGSTQKRQEKEIINEIYALRANKFGSSTPQIQAAARERMENEKRQALALTSGKAVA